VTCYKRQTKFVEGYICIGVIWAQSMTWSTPVYSMKIGPALAIGKSEFGSSYNRNSGVSQ